MKNYTSKEIEAMIDKCKGNEGDKASIVIKFVNNLDEEHNLLLTDSTDHSDVVTILEYLNPISHVVFENHNVKGDKKLRDLHRRVTEFCIDKDLTVFTMINNTTNNTATRGYFAGWSPMERDDDVVELALSLDKKEPNGIKVRKVRG